MRYKPVRYLQSVVFAFAALSGPVGGQSSCEKQSSMQTEIGRRYELGMSIPSSTNYFPIQQNDARYLRASFTVARAPLCNWVIVVRDERHRAIKVYDHKTLNASHAWTPRVKGKLLSIEIVPCSTGDRPSVMIQSYIAMQNTSTNPYYSFQDDSHPKNRELFSGDSTVLDSLRRLGDNVGFVMSSAGAIAWACSGVMLNSTTFLTSWHCGGAGRLPLSSFWNDNVIQDTIIDLSWDGDDFSREYSATRLIVGDSTLDYALINVAPFDMSDEVQVLSSERDPLTVGETLYLVHHMEGLPKQISMCSLDAISASVDEPANEILHSCDSEKGSSGAPLFDLKGKVIAIHRAGFDQDDHCKVLDRENKAVTMGAILRDVKKKNPSAFEVLVR